MYYFFDDILNIKNLYLISIKIIEKSYKNFLINYLGHVTPNSAKPLYLIINNATRYIEERNEIRI